MLAKVVYCCIGCVSEVVLAGGEAANRDACSSYDGRCAAGAAFFEHFSLLHSNLGKYKHEGTPY